MMGFVGMDAGPQTLPAWGILRSMELREGWYAVCSGESMNAKSETKQKTSVIKRSKTVLLIIDMLNTLDFPQGKSLLKNALPAAKAIVRLKKRMKQKGLAVIYVNNNFGQWRSDWKEVYAACAHPRSKGQALAALLRPEKDDYFVLKPKHSAFQSTALDVLLEHLHCKKIIITGVAADICVFFTIQDAHARNFEIVVPSDCVASNHKKEKTAALAQIRKIFSLRPVAAKNLKI